MRKRHGALPADTLRVLASPGKEREVLRFVADYRRLAVQVGRMQWRRFFEQGATNKYTPAKHLNGICGAVSMQMASFQSGATRGGLHWMTLGRWLPRLVAAIRPLPARMEAERARQT